MTTEAPRPFKVTRIIGRLNIGGPARQACYLHENLRGQFETVLIAGRIDAHEGDMSYLLQSNSGIYWIGSMSRPVRFMSDMASAWRIYRILRHEHPNLVHTHTAKAGAVGRVAAILAGVPCIVHTYHGNVFRGYFGPLKTWLYKKIEQTLNRFTTRVIAISESQAEELATVHRVVPRKKIQVIRTGFELPAPAARELRIASRQVLHLSEEKVAILWAGRFVPIKNLDLLIAVIEQASVQVPKLHFLIAGDGAEKEKFSRLQNKENFTLLGWQTDLSPYFAASDAVLLTSSNEGTPAVLIEGMAAARPFVSTNVGGVKDLAAGPIQTRSDGGQRADNGFLVPGEPDVIVTCLKQLSESSELRQKMGDAGREFVVRHHSAQRLLEDIASLYKELLQQKPSRS